MSGARGIARTLARAVALAVALAAPARAQLVPAPKGALGTAARALERAAREQQRQKNASRYDDVFRKYTKRYFGLGTDWRQFKAQGMAESNLDPRARSWVGARGIMQLMPATYKSIQSGNRALRAIDDPEWNIAAGIMHDRYLWGYWAKEVPDEAERARFMFASYNAGQGTILRAHGAAAAARLDHDRWQSIEAVAPSVPRWRYGETLGYVRKIRANLDSLPRDR